MRSSILPLIAVGVMLVAAGQASAKEYQVTMLNTGPGGAMVFSPAVVKAKPGDTVRFIPTDKGHNVETVPGMLPTGAVAVRGAMNKEVVVTLTAAGIYGLRCLPHWGMGMIAIIQVGPKPANRAAAEAAAAKAPPMARKRFAAGFATLTP